MRKTSRRSLIPVLVVLALLPAGCQTLSSPVSPAEKTMLWNGADLTGWKLVLEDENMDVYKVWSIREGVIHCKGKPNGYMRTEQQYKDYRLHVEWRWPEEPTNSGVFLHISGADKVWPRTIECQLKAGSAGDFVLINGTGVTVDGRDRQDLAKQFVGVTKKQTSSERPAGQWNAYDIVCSGDRITCSVNGVLQNEGLKATDTAGWIGLQSEGSPIEFRNVYIEPLD